VKQQIVTLCLAIGALALCYALFFPKSPSNAQAAPRPLSTELGPTGYQAAWRWLQQEHISVAALRDRFDTPIAARAPHSIGNVLLTTVPYKIELRSSEAARLDAWIERGNTLVVAAALDDTPGWALADGAAMVKELGRLTRLKFEVDADKSAVLGSLGSAFSALTAPLSVQFEAQGAHPLMEGVHSLRFNSDLPASHWRAAPMDGAAVLQVAKLAETRDGAVWIRRQGNGQVITLAAAGLFSNRDIGKADNARLLSNIIARSIKPGGHVLFDDVHQGAVDYYDAKAFFADARLHRSIGWLVLLWFVFVLGMQTLQPHIGNWRPVDVTAFVRTSGEFFAATLTPTAAGARLMTNFFDDVRRRVGFGEIAGAAWQWLSAQAGVSARDLARLQDFQEKIRDGKRFDLLQLQNLLVKLQGKIV
jgi:hypothetical protein